MRRRYCEWCGEPLERNSAQPKRFCGSGCRGRHSEWVQAGKPTRDGPTPHKQRPRRDRAGIEVYLVEQEVESLLKGYARMRTREKLRDAIDRRQR
jgi:hypothetical protein